MERLYPEVYRVVYPMVCYACDNVRTPVNDELLNMMTDDIYDRVEADCNSILKNNSGLFCSIQNILKSAYL